MSEDVHRLVQDIGTMVGDLVDQVRKTDSTAALDKVELLAKMQTEMLDEVQDYMAPETAELWRVQETMVLEAVARRRLELAALRRMAG